MSMQDSSNDTMSLSVSKTLLTAVFLVLTAAFLPRCDGALRVGESVTKTVNSGTMQTLSYNISKSASTAYRLSTFAPEANLSHPVFVSVRQGRHITSWTLPYIEDGHAFLRVERTLCPILNAPLNSNSTTPIQVDVSSSTSFNQSVSVLLDIVEDFVISKNSSVNVTISAPSPVFYVYEFPPGNDDDVLVTVTSNSDVCALVSVQDILCPNDQLLEYPSQRGTFQTMERLAAITYPRPAHQDFFYIVVTVLHDDRCTQANRDLIDGLVRLNNSAQYNPVFVHEQELFTEPKIITINIRPTFPRSKFWRGPLVSFIVYFLLYIVTMVWISIEWRWGYRKQHQHGLMEKIEEGIEQTDGGTRVPLVRRPSFISVLWGTHWTEELDRKLTVTTPSPRGRDYIEQQCEQTDGGTGEQSPDIVLHALLEQYPAPNSDVQRQMSCPEPRNNSTSIQIELQSETNNIITNASDNGTLLTPPLSCNDVSESHEDIPSLGHHRTQSYENAINSSHESSTDYLTLIKVKMSDLDIPEGEEFQRRYNGYWAYVIAIVLFYAIPTYQLVLTYQKYLYYTGNQDFCYYNSLCSHRLGIFSAFNNIWSNIGFFMLGFLFLVVARRRREKYCFSETVNQKLETIKKKHENKIGVPQHFGIYYAVGMALMGEGVMSSAYHICPTGSNYQFDTTMMFVLVTLGLYKLYECRNPDKCPAPHKLLLALALMILFIGMGVIYSNTIGFYVSFFIIFETVAILVSLQHYYRWIKLCSWNSLKEILLEFYCNVLCRPCSVQHKCKFVYMIISILINLIGGLVGIICRPEDFATFFLVILILNFLFHLAYYAVAKGCYREYRIQSSYTLKDRIQSLYTLKPVVYLILSLICWITGLFLYGQAITNWLESPAGSRNNNDECIILGFFDTHDLWHFSSAFALFFSFLLLMTIDDDQESTNRSQLHIF